MATSKSGALNFTPVFCLRRFVLAFATVFFSETLWLQLFVFTYSTLFAACFFIGIRPMNQKLLNRIEMFNETATLGSLYFILYFTEWCDNVELRSDVGQMYMYYVILIASANFFLIAGEIIGQVLKKPYYFLKRMIIRWERE